MTPRSRRKETPHPVAVRLPKVARRQLDDLTALWGENQSQAIIRCIERVWMMEAGPSREGKRQSPSFVDGRHSKEAQSMMTKIASVHSVDGNLELALFPASIELLLSDRAARAFDEAMEREKKAGWLPVWKQIRESLLTAAQRLGHQVADRLIEVPLEAVEDVAYAGGKLRVLTKGGNQLSGNLGIQVGDYDLQCDLGGEGLFPEAEAQAFTERFRRATAFIRSGLSGGNLGPTPP